MTGILKNCIAIPSLLCQALKSPGLRGVGGRRQVALIGYGALDIMDSGVRVRPNRPSGEDGSL
jgi:hypothetical protein